MTLKKNNIQSSINLFEFDKSFCHCEKGQMPDVAIQEKPCSPFTVNSSPVLIIGTDEAGRGPGAGGVFASAVYFNDLNDDLIQKLSSLNDSKKLSKKKREELYEIILNNTINSTVCIEVEEIEKINILNASLKAMRFACENVIEEIENRKSKIVGRDGNPAENSKTRRVGSLTHLQGLSSESRVGLLSDQHESTLILVDGNKLIKELNSTTSHRRDGNPALRHTSIQQQFIIKGDSKSASIAAASILAKVSRDKYMEELDKKFPQYNWSKNAGYLTKEHLNAIDKYGITPVHRKSFLRKHEERCSTNQLSLYQK